MSSFCGLRNFISYLSYLHFRYSPTFSLGGVFEDPCAFAGSMN